MVLSLAACGDGSNSEASKDPSSPASSSVDDNFKESMEVNNERKLSTETDRYDTITIAVSNEVNNLQPYSQSDAGILPIMYNIYESLFDVKKGTVDEFYPRLAKSYEDTDELHCVVELFDYIKDSEGNPITADDVVFSYELYLDSGFATGDILTYYESCKALDSTHVEFTWSKPVTGLTAYANIFGAVYVVAEAAYDQAKFANNAVGTGPYKVKEFVTGSYTLLEANEDYWQTDEEYLAPNAHRNVQNIRYDIIADSAMRLIALEEGSASYCLIDDASLPDFTTGGKYDGQYQLITSYATTSQNIMFNLSEESIMSDINMRLAVCYAVNVDDIAYAMGEATYSACTENMSPAVPGYQSAWDEPRDDFYFTYDVELAKEYLQKANYNGEEIKLTTGTFKVKADQAEMIARYLEEAGMKISLQPLENAVLQGTYSDASAWDINIYSLGSSTSAAAAINNMFGVDYGKIEGLNMELIYDEKLQELIDICTSIEGYSDESVNATMEYIRDNVYAYGTISQKYLYAFDLCYAELQWNNTGNILIPGSCTYYLD